MEHVLIVSEVHVEELLLQTRPLPLPPVHGVVEVAGAGEVLLGQHQLRLVHLREHDAALPREPGVHLADHVQHVLAQLEHESSVHTNNGLSIDDISHPCLLY